MTATYVTSKIIVALDFADRQAALRLVEQLTPQHCKLKIGKEMFTRFGPEFVRVLVAKGFDVFLDLKFHDIPNTVAKAVQAAAELGVWMVNVHAAGGEKMMQAARQALDQLGGHSPILLGVTVLTSIGAADLNTMGITATPQEQVSCLAQLAQNSGLDGVVCSAHEVSHLKAQLGNEFILVTPGIRPMGSAVGDQQRVVTPQQAILNGSDYLVIGRPITQATDPLMVLNDINLSLS